METAVDNLVMFSGQNVQSNAAAIDQMSMQCQLAAAILFSGRTEEIRITLISSIDQLGYFLDEYVLQPIGIKQRLMQLQRFIRELPT